MDYVGICAIAKDEHLVIEEWVQYHALLGVERFIVYDNGSTIPIKETLGVYLEKGFVDVIEVPGQFLQSECYNHCLNKYGQDIRWIAFIDLDEFIVLKDNKWLPAFLLEYEEFGGVVVNWAMFSSSGHLRRPKGLVIENYLQKHEMGFRGNLTVKSIVQPRFVESSNLTPHFFTYKEGYYNVNENKVICHGNQAPFNVKKININHYRIQSQEDFQRRIEKWSYDRDEMWKSFYYQAACPTDVDKTLIEKSKLIKRLSKNPDFFKKIAREYCKHGDLFEYLEQAYLELNAKRYDEALRIMAKAGLYYGHIPDYVLQKGYIYLEIGRPDLALEAVNQILSKFFLLEAYVLLYYIMIQQNNLSDAEGVLNYIDLMTLKHREQGVAYDQEIEEFVAKNKKGARY